MLFNFFKLLKLIVKERSRGTTYQYNKTKLEFNLLKINLKKAIILNVEFLTTQAI